VEQALADGATALTGAKRPSGKAFTHGYWYEPTVLVGVGSPEIIGGDVGLTVLVTHSRRDTGFDIAGENRANPRNMKAAMALAAELSLRSRLRTAKSQG
jgi:hypothetical protein